MKMSTFCFRPAGFQLNNNEWSVKLLLFCWLCFPHVSLQLEEISLPLHPVMLIQCISLRTQMSFWWSPGLFGDGNMVVNVKESASLMSERSLETRTQPDGMSFEMEKTVTPSSQVAISHTVDVLFIVHITQVHLLLVHTLIFMPGPHLALCDQLSMLLYCWWKRVAAATQQQQQQQHDNVKLPCFYVESFMSLCRNITFVIIIM